MNIKQHFQLPNDMMESHEINAYSQLIYLILKSFYNASTGECFPSLRTLATIARCGVNKIRDCIKELEEAEYISTEVRGRKTYYTFSPYKNFEPFSPEFLKKDLPFPVKAYYAAMQQYMIKDENKQQGVIGYPLSKCEQLTKMDSSTISRIHKQLTDLGLMELKTKNGVQEKRFNLIDLGQAIVFKLKEHEEKLDKHEDEIENLKAEVLELKRQLAEQNNANSKGFVL